MEYEFINDPITQLAKAKFSLEHEVFGPWLETEVGNSESKLTELLTAIDNVETHRSHEQQIIGSEYTVTFEKGEVAIAVNTSLNGVESLPEMLTDEHIDYDNFDSACCGSDDFRRLLLAWSRFVAR